MYIYDYYIIIYDKLFQYEKYYEEFINKKKDKIIDYKQIIPENNINKLPDTKVDNQTNNNYNDLVKSEIKMKVQLIFYQNIKLLKNQLIGLERFLPN